MRHNAWISMLLGLLVLVAVGCSDSGDPATPTGGGDNNGIEVEFSNYAQLITAVAPPEYEPGAAQSKDLSIWTDGDYSLLGKVIGSAECDEPMSLHRNLNFIDFVVETLEMALANGEGVGVGETPEGYPVTATITIDELTEPVMIPEMCRRVIGLDQVELQTVCKFNVATLAIEVHFGFAQTAERELILAWEDELGIATNLMYASHDLVTDQVIIRAVFWKTTGSEITSWVYDIGTAGEDNSEFTYNMAWYSDQFGDSAAVACVNGSGDRDTRFGLRYHQYRAPWSRGQYDSWGPYEQLFGPVGDNPYADLNESGEYPVAHADLIDEAAMFVYDDFPTGRFASPFE
ncbi:MAG: hypothetical protein ABIF77_10970 [bacterium]